MQTKYEITMVVEVKEESVMVHQASILLDAVVKAVEGIGGGDKVEVEEISTGTPYK